MFRQIVQWYCHCGKFTRNRFPNNKDAMRLKGVSNVWSLSHDPILGRVADTIECVGIRKCKYCGEEKAIIVYNDGGWGSCQSFAYSLDSKVGKRVLEILKDSNNQ